MQTREHEESTIEDSSVADVAALARIDWYSLAFHCSPLVSKLIGTV